MFSEKGKIPYIGFRLFFFVMFVFFILFSFSFGQSDYSVMEALKVMDLIEKIQIEQLEKDPSELRRIVVTEREFNAYIAYRIDVEQEEILKELRFKIYDENKIEGKVVVDLKGQKLPQLLRPEMTFFMGGTLEVNEGKARLDLKDLFLENQRIQPMVLDLVIYIGSKVQKTEPWSIKDWFDLPFGIKNIETKRGRIIFAY
jgi:hypothetical protein